MASGDEILGQLEGIVFGDDNGSMANKDKKKRKKKEAEEGRSID